MRHLTFGLLLLLSFSYPSNIHAQTGNAKSLLWRISGRGLSNPSYLYGTMHLYDRRLFQFGDSVYNSLGETEAYAMELDPHSMMDTLLSKLNEEDTTSLLQTIMEKKEYSAISKKLEKKLGVPADRITRKMLMKERDKEVFKHRNKDDMNTAVDLYLYNIARNQGHWVGGIEDVDDQLGLTDEIGRDFNVKEFLENDDRKVNESIEKMIKLYVNEDIDKIEEWTNTNESAGTKNILLTRRNMKMARRMDSLSALRTTFFAVGAAHLPGDSGVISLLRKRGFMVEPVFSSKKIAPADYKFSSKEFPWTNVTGPESVYTADMPGRPTDINKFGDELQMKMYGDLFSNTFYMTGFIQIDSNTNKEDIVNRVMESYSLRMDKGKGQPRTIINHGIKGLEIIGEKDNVYFRVQLFLPLDKEYMAVVGSISHDNLYTKDANRFLENFVMNTNIEIKNKKWVTYTDSLKAFSLSFPKAPEVYKRPAHEVQKNWTSTIYSSFDIKENTYYLLNVNEIKKGYIMSADSSYFDQQYQNFISDTSYHNLKKNDTTFNGLPAIHVTCESTKSGQRFFTDLITANKGNRNFSLITVTDNNHERAYNTEQFDKSFKLLPYKVPGWKNRIVSNGRFSTFTPSTIEEDVADTAGMQEYEIANAIETAKRMKQYFVYDPYASITYNINVYPVSPYYWTYNDSTFYDDQTAIYFTDTLSYNSYTTSKNSDSLIYSRAVKIGLDTGRELLVKRAGSNFYKKIRVVRNGDSVYHLFAFILESDLNNENNYRFFNDFAIHAKATPLNIFENKTLKILADLESPDSATHEDVLLAITGVHFTQQDLPLLLPALVKKHTADTTDFALTNSKLASVIQPLMNDTVINFIADAYLKTPASYEPVRQQLIELLADYKTLSSYRTLGNLFIQRPPQENNSRLVYLLEDSLELAATMFPAIEKLYQDSAAASFVIRLSVKLIDSSLLSAQSARDNSTRIYEIARTQISNYKRDPKNYYDSYTESLIKMLGILDTEESEQLLREYVSFADLEIKQYAILALLAKNKEVPAAQLNKIAADKYSRLYFYDALKEINKISSYPAKWRTQKLLGESYLCITCGMKMT